MVGKLAGLSPDVKVILFRQWIFSLGVEKLDNIVRSNGKSMTLHISNVTRLLREFHATLETWVAGALHDIEEGYIAEHPHVTRARVKAKLRVWLHEIGEQMVNQAADFGENSAEEMFERFSDNFITEVLTMIEAVTEPVKSDVSGNWLERKSTYISQVAEGNENVALLSCATKIDALMNVVQLLHDKSEASISEYANWSSGTTGYNIWLFEELLLIYHSKNIDPNAIQIYEHYLTVFKELAEEIFADHPDELNSPDN